jgi:hypothetical protein
MTVDVPIFWSYEWVLWVSVWCYSLHIVEEYFFDWKSWAEKVIGLKGSWQDFVTVERLSPKSDSHSPTLITRVWSPGTCTATLLYLPCVGFVYWGAQQDVVLTPFALWSSIAIGFVLMFGLVGSVKYAKKLNAKNP